MPSGASNAWVLIKSPAAVGVSVASSQRLFPIELMTPVPPRFAIPISSPAILVRMVFFRLNVCVSPLRATKIMPLLLFANVQLSSVSVVVPPVLRGRVPALLMVVLVR